MPAEKCGEPACESKQDKLKKALNFGKIPPVPSDGNLRDQVPKLNRDECPLDREELGRATWGFLHTTAAYYPDTPSEVEKTAARGIIEGVAQLYPCTHCREHFASEIVEDPIDYTDRKTLSRSLCKHHNTVNQLLGKKLFDCSDENLQTRWRTGKRDCS